MSKLRVLLAEDNEDNFDLVSLLLQRAGYEVLAARDGKEALEMARSQKPDLILMDLSLPEIDGWTVARRLKANAETKNIPIFALTAHTLPGDRKRALEAGCDGYFSKPLSVAGFGQALAEALEKVRAAREAKAASSSTP
jgi:CheY-like chemotaxis protein